jgi:hypothetical protein
MYTTEKNERRVLGKLQGGITVVESQCEYWNIKNNKGKTPAMYFPIRLTVPEDVL